MGKAYASSQHCTRTRLLNKLGLFQEPPNHGEYKGGSPVRRAGSSAAHNPSKHAPRSILGSVVPFEARLNDEDEAFSGRHDPPRAAPRGSPLFPLHFSPPLDRPGMPNRSAPLTPSQSPSSLSSASRASCASTTKTLSFKDTVSVVPIPSHNQYSSRIKKHLWSNATEIREMAQRNYLEFQSEGFDWRNVVLDEEMYIDSINGQLVHPCHFPASGSSFSSSSSSPHPEEPEVAPWGHHERETKEELEETSSDHNEPIFGALQRRVSEVFDQPPPS